MNKDNLSDERLVVLHQRKRANAFFILYKRYRSYAYAIILNNLDKNRLTNALKDEKDAILYDAIIEAVSVYDKKRGTFRQLLSTIIENMTLNHIQKFRRDPLSDYISLDANLQDGTNLMFADSLTFADKNESPQEIINLDDNNKKVETNYQGVYKRRIKKMISLRKEGFTYEEIAKLYDTSEKAVRSIFYRIKRRIDVRDNNKIKK